MQTAYAAPPPTVAYDAQPLVLIVADGAPGVARARTAIEAAGGRARHAVPIADAAALLDPAPAEAAVWVDVAEDHGAALDRLLDALATAVGNGACAGVVRCAAPLIDIAAARLALPEIPLLIDSDPLEDVAALALALARPAPTHLHEGRGEAPHLRQLSEEVGRIARALAALAGETPPALTAPPGEDAAPGALASLPPVATVRAAIRARRLRDSFFAADLFADPAWDMLLDLFAARIERRAVAVSSLCIASSVPPTTALRWITRLTDEGVFVRANDPRDGRRVFIDLSTQAIEAMSGYFRAIERTGVSFG